MKLSKRTIDAAFDRHRHYYANERLWGINYHVECWRTAAEAFEGTSDEAFIRLYGELRGRWQVFRSRKWKAPTPRKVQRMLGQIDTQVRSLRLTDLADGTPETLTLVWRAIVKAAAVKVNSDGPSVMALSKFLHFWNPRLFIIVDREVMARWVFRHRWLWDEVQGVAAQCFSELPGEVSNHPFFRSLNSYLSVLAWGGAVLRGNSKICKAFDRYVRESVPNPGLPLHEYEAAALEWLLLGLVELPPDGIVLDHSVA